MAVPYFISTTFKVFIQFYPDTPKPWKKTRYANCYIALEVPEYYIFVYSQN